MEKDHCGGIGLKKAVAPKKKKYNYMRRTGLYLTLPLMQLELMMEGRQAETCRSVKFE